MRGIGRIENTDFQGPDLSGTGVAKRARQPTVPKFSGKNTFLIPDASDIRSVPGMFGPKASVIPLCQNFLTHGRPASVVSSRLPTIGLAQKFRLSTDLLIRSIRQDRVQSARQQADRLLRQLQVAGNDEPTQQRVLQSFFGLDDSPDAHALIRGLRRLYRETGTIQAMAGLSSGRGSHQTLNRLLQEVRRTLTSVLQAGDVGLSTDEALTVRQKTVNRIVDRLAPRRVLVGHSLGGVISYKALQEMTGDVAMVISLGSPLNGTPEIVESLEQQIEAALKTFGPEKLTPPPFRNLVHKANKRFIEAILKAVADVNMPAVPQMRKGSRSVQKLQAEPIPFDTTAISIANPSDGLIRPEDARHNTQKPAHLNLQVTPLEETFSALTVGPMQALAKTNPLGQRLLKMLDRHELFAGVRQHLGLVANYEHYWLDNGELNRKVFDGPDAVAHLKTLLDARNYEPVREEVLDWMLARLDNSTHRKKYAELVPVLNEIARQPLPFENSSDKLARRVLARLRGTQEAS